MSFLRADLTEHGQFCQSVNFLFGRAASFFLSGPGRHLTDSTRPSATLHGKQYFDAHNFIGMIHPDSLGSGSVVLREGVNSDDVSNWLAVSNSRPADAVISTLDPHENAHVHTHLVSVNVDGMAITPGCEPLPSGGISGLLKDLTTDEVHQLFLAHQSGKEAELWQAFAARKFVTEMEEVMITRIPDSAVHMSVGVFKKGRKGGYEAVRNLYNNIMQKLRSCSTCLSNGTYCSG